MTDATVYAVASGKGGVGKTTTAVNLGASFANAGQSVVVVDLDLGMANLGDFIEATPAGPTLHDVLAGEATLDDALSHAESNLDVIFGSEALADFAKADPARIRNHLVTLRERYDVVILDSGGGLSHDTALPLGLADEILIVSTVEDPAIANVKKTIELVDRLDGTIEGLVLTRVGGGEAADPTTVAESLGLRLLGAVPEDSTVKKSASAGEPLQTFDPDCPAAQAYREMAYDLLDEPLPMNIGSGDRTTGSDASTEDVMDAVASTAIAAEEPDDTAAGESVDSSAEVERSTEAAVAETEDGSESEAEGVESATPGTDGPGEETREEAEGESSDGEEESGVSEEESGVSEEESSDGEEESSDVDADAADDEAGEEQSVSVEQSEAETEESAESRSLLWRLTGGLIG